MALEISRERERIAAEAVADLGRFTPERTTWLGWHRLTVGCTPCGLGREFLGLPIPARLYCTPWSEVMRHLVCSRCGTPTDYVSLSRKAAVGHETMASLDLRAAYQTAPRAR